MTLQLDFGHEGVLVGNHVVPGAVVSRLRTDFERVAAGGAGSRVFDLPQELRDLIGPRGAMGAFAARLAGRPNLPVRVLFFDKTVESNWAVPWHQDRTIAVKARVEFGGFGPWSIKDGIVHVEPPVSVLDSMLTLRLFIDDCGEDNGPLEVAIGSHRLGRVPGADVADIVRRSAIFPGVGRAGDVLAMRALAIHASRRAKSPTHRRVLHVDYAAIDLPPPLEWGLD